MRRSALVMDLDGTFYDSKEIDRENKAAAAAAISAHEGLSIQQAEAILRNEHLISQRSTAGILYDRKVPDDLTKKFQLKMISPERYLQKDEEIRPLLQRLQSKFKIALYTNTRHEIAVRALKALMLEKFEFDAVIAGGDTCKPKPDVDSLKDLLKALDCDPRDSCTVGDRWDVDHAPGQLLGMTAIEVKGRDAFVAWLKSAAEA